MFKRALYTVFFLLLLAGVVSAAPGLGISAWTKVTEALTDSDYFAITDVSDATQSDDGSTKAATGTQVKSWLASFFAPILPVEINGSTAQMLTAAQVSGTIITNYGQGAANISLQLPTAASGYNFLATVGTAQAYKWGCRAGANDKFYLLNDDGTVTSNVSDNQWVWFVEAQVGQSFACWTFKTGASAWDWMCKAGATGTSTFELGP